MTLSDPFKDAMPDLIPADVDLPRGLGDGIYVWVAGNLEFMTEGGTVVGPYPVVAGQYVPFRCQQIRAGTTATVSVGTH